MNFKKTVLTLLSAAFLTVGLFADTVVVTTTNEYGPGSLGEAITVANTDPSLTNIEFNIAGGGRIVVTDGLPLITSQVEIDGANPGGPVVVEGASPSGPGRPVSGFLFRQGSDNSVISNVTTEGFLFAVWVENAKGVRVFNNTFKKPFSIALRLKAAANIIVHDNAVSEAGQGFLFEDTTGVLVDNNVFETLGQHNVIVSRSQQVDIYRNKFNSGTLGIYNSAQVVVGAPNRGNTFNNNKETAVKVRGDGAGYYVVSNVFTGQQQKAVDVAGPLSQIEVSLNTFVNVKEWDIQVIGTKTPLLIFKNSIKGNSPAVYAGINLADVNGGSVQGNLVDGGRVLLENSSNVTVGGVGVDANIFTNDPLGYSSNAALTLSNSHNNEVYNNTINNNAANGVVITNDSSNNSFVANKIHDNGRTGILAYSGNGNKFSQNIIFGHHSDIYGGINSISLTGNANDGKQPPVITSVNKTNESVLTIKGTGTPGDTVEVFRSNKPTSQFDYDAIAGPLHIATVAADSTWSVTIATPQLPELYVTAVATGADNNSSELAVVKGIVLNDGITGPDEVVSRLPYTYSVADNPGVNFQWWVNGDASIFKTDLTGNTSSEVKITFFNAPGSTVTVNVSYDDPIKGYVHKTLDVTIK